MASKKIVTASTVRTWATEQGLTVGKRGRLSPEVRKAFAEANKGQSYEVGHKEIVTEFVTARAEGVRTKRVKVNVAEVRKAAQEAGVAVGKRGRITAEVKEAFVLGRLDTLV